MTRQCYLALVFFLAVLPAVTQSDVLPPLPAQAPSPLLYVRFLGPEGMHVTFFRGLTPPRDVAAPVTVGLRPGYLQRVQLSGIPDLPGVTLSPTLEVHGTLCLPPRLSPADYPAPIELTS